MRHAVSLHRPIADSIRCAKESCALILHKYHRLSLVCLCFSSDHKFLVGCSKDGTITKCLIYFISVLLKHFVFDDIEGRRKVVSLHCRKSNLHSHSGQVNCCAISTSSKYLATGGVDKLVKIWDFNSFTFLGEFKEHRGQITSLAFRKQINSNELFSSSSDRSIKVCSQFILAWKS